MVLTGGQGAMCLTISLLFLGPSFHLVDGDDTGFLRVVSFGLHRRWFCCNWECLGIAYVLTGLLRSFGEGALSISLLPSLSLSFPSFLLFPPLSFSQCHMMSYFIEHQFADS